MEQLRPELGAVLQSLSLNGYSIFSLIDYILASYNREDQRVVPLREEIERDTADICIRLLSHNPAGPKRVLDFGRAQFNNSRHAVTIDILPDNVFLELFDFCLCQFTEDPIQRTKKWQILVHVCQRWRRIIFSSARRLDLYLSCSLGTRVRKNLAYWPVTMPLSVDYAHHRSTLADEVVVLAALEYSGRVHRIGVHGTDYLLKIVAKAMRKPFPALSHLDIAWDCNGKLDPPLGSVPVIPRRFLGRSASRLQHLCLSNISFPHLPTFLLSASNLVTVKLENIFQDGHAYISPEAMAGGLAMLPRLTTLSIELHYETPPADQSSHQDPLIRAILPSLTAFYYMGFSEYLEDFLAKIDTPRLDHVKIKYYAHDLRALQLSRFLNRTENLKFNRFRRAKVVFFDEAFSIKFDFPPGGGPRVQLSLTLQAWIDTPAPFLGQLATTFSNLDHLSAHGDRLGLAEMHSTEWLPFLRQFPAVEALHLSGRVAVYIASALEHTAGSVTDLLPALHLIWLDDEEDDVDGVPVESIERFRSVRQLSGRPVTIVDTYDEFVEADRNPL